MPEVLRQIRIALLLLILLSVITGLLYPALITVIAQECFPWRANGSLIMKDDKAIASQFIGQSFSANKYFWSRPSATSPYAYNSAASSGSNLGPTNPDLLASVKKNIDNLKQTDPDHQSAIPVDMVTSSGSGLDPEISPYAAMYQVPRVAKARGVSTDVIIKIVQENILPRSLTFMGEPRVNVVQLNLALDAAGLRK